MILISTDKIDLATFEGVPNFDSEKKKKKEESEEANMYFKVGKLQIRGTQVG